METLFIWESAFILVLAAWGIDVDNGADNIALICGVFFPATSYRGCLLSKKREA